MTKDSKPEKKADFWFEDTVLWRLKTYLQFTGWLQYLTTLLSVVVALLLAAIAAWIGFGAWFFLAIAGVLFLIFVIDLVTVRYNIRPSEPLPKPGTSLDEFQLMRARQSCRSFQDRKLTPEHLAAIIQLLERYTKPEELIGDKAIRLVYMPERLKVWPVLGAQEFLVALAPKEYDRMSVIDVGRNLQKVVHEATRMGIATCWIGPGADQSSVIAALGDRFDPETDHMICVCAIGYKSIFKPLMLRLADWVGDHRLPIAELFFEDVDQSRPVEIKSSPYDSYGRCYEVCQWAPSSYNSQTTRCISVINVTDANQPLSRFDFGAATGSRYYAAVAVGIWCTNWEIGCKELGKNGEIKVLSTGERGVQSESSVFHYDLSWVID